MTLMPSYRGLKKPPKPDPGEVHALDTKALFSLLAADAYNNTNYPERPEKPAVLGKRADALTIEEINTLQEVKNRFAVAREGYDKAKGDHALETQRLLGALRYDVRSAFGTHHNPKEDLLWGICWDERGDCGLHDVVRLYSTLVILIQG